MSEPTLFVSPAEEPTHRNSIGGIVRRVGWEELINLFTFHVRTDSCPQTDEDANWLRSHDDVQLFMENMPEAVGLVLFENLMMDSSAYGARALVPFDWQEAGSVNSLARVISSPIGDAPSRFKYPVAYWVKNLPIKKEEDANS